MAKRPLVSTTIRTEFGDVLDDPSFYDVSGADRDLTYVPGFSEMRRARDLDLAAIASGEKKAHEVNIKPLSVNCHWTRTHTPKGAPDGRKQIAIANLGYRTATKADIGQPWLTALPPGAVLNADGTIQKGDTILTVADGKTAARNAARKQAQTQRMSDPGNVGASGLLGSGLKAPGTDPFIRKEA